MSIYGPDHVIAPYDVLFERHWGKPQVLYMVLNGLLYGPYMGPIREPYLDHILGLSRPCPDQA